MAFEPLAYRQLVDDILTRITGGISRETHVFAEGQSQYELSHRPVRANGIVSVRGIVEGAKRAFPASDYRLVDGRFIELTGTTPDPGTVFTVNYYPSDANAQITDRNPGSAARTLTEAFSLEVAELHARLDRVYRSAFVDTAEGRSLDFVVALLGVERIKAGRPYGRVEFARSTPAPADIAVPLGTAVADREGNRYATSEAVRMRNGESSVEAPVLAASDDTPVLPAGSLTIVPRPVAGIESVFNYEATSRSTEDESDADLRSRAKVALYGAGKATVDALRFAILEQGVRSVVVRDMPNGTPGEVDVIVDFGSEEAAKREDVLEAIEATRPAGIRVYLNPAESIPLSLEVTLTIEPGFTGQMEGIRHTARDRVVTYVSSLAAGESVLGNRIVALLMDDSRVRNVEFAFSPGPGLDRAISGTDISVGRKEKASLAEDDIIITVEVATSEEEAQPTPEGFAPIEATISVFAEVRRAFIDAVGDLEEAKNRVRTMVRAKVDAYTSELFPGDEITLRELRRFLESDKYTILDATEMQNIHTKDGLVVRLSGADDTDRIRDGEGFTVASIDVTFQ